MTVLSAPKNQTQQQKSKQTNKKIKQGKNDNLTFWSMTKKCIFINNCLAAEAVLVMHKKSTTTVKQSFSDKTESLSLLKGYT